MGYICERKNHSNVLFVNQFLFGKPLKSKKHRQQLAPLGVFLVSMAATGAAHSAACNPGTFSSNGQDNPSSCTPAPLGSFVPTAAATSATLAPPGSFVSVTGATAAQLAPPGRYVPSSGQTAALLAPVGSYVPTAGATAATLASPGTFVSVTGATMATPAPAGSYVPTSGATQAILAQAGTYVPTAGQASPTQVSQGFYTYADGATQQVPAGLVAAPLNASIRANEAALQSTTALINSQSNDPIKMTTYYQLGSVDQVGQSTGGKQDISFWGLNLVANAFGPKDEPGGFLAGVSLTNYSAGSDGNGDGFGFTLGAFKKFKLGPADLTGTVSYGSYDYNTTRSNLSQGAVAGSPALVQSATSNSRVNTYSVNMFASVPLSQTLPSLEGFSNLAVSSYDFGGFNETAQNNGTQPNAALNVGSSNYVSIPLTLGLRYVVKDTASQNPLMTVSVGYKYDFGSAKTLSFNAQSVNGYSFGVPVALTNTNAFVMNIASSHYEIVKDLYVNASIAAELSGRYSFYQGTLNLIKRF